MQASDGRTSMAIAPRMLPDRAVAVARPGQTVIGTASGGDHELIRFDASSNLAVLRVPAVEDSAVTIRQTPLRSGPRYVGLVEPSGIGPVLRPAYIGRTDTFEDPRTGMTLLAVAGLQAEAAAGSAMFSLDGIFVGLIRDIGDTIIVIPADQLRASAEKAQASPSPSRGDLGIEVDLLTGPLVRATGAEQGAIVVRVRPGGPADGVLQSGDVIQSIDGVPVISPASLRELERSRKPGATVAVTAIRNRSPLEVTITAADVAAQTGATDDPGVVGRTVSGVGIEIIAVRDGSAAARAGLHRGDLILAVDGERAPETSALIRRFRAADAGASFLVTIQRGEQHRVLAIEKR